VFRADYQNVKKRCTCEKYRQEFVLDTSKITNNNLGGYGPTSGAEEIRYSEIGKTPDGKLYDLVVKVPPGQTYKTIFAKERNGVLGQLGNINVDVEVTAQNKGIQMTEFDFSFRDSITDDEIVLDDFRMSFYDFDVNKAQNLHERVCIANDQFDPFTSTLPTKSDHIKVYPTLTNCAGKASSKGSVLLESEGVGFLCDNPKEFDDLADIPCDKCFNKVQCGKAKVSKFFPIKRSQRVTTFAFSSRAKFTISLGISCEKPIGETCNRNFLFSFAHNKCTEAKK
jgi:hypothetical protein